MTNTKILRQLQEAVPESRVHIAVQYVYTGKYYSVYCDLNTPDIIYITSNHPSYPVTNPKYKTISAFEFNQNYVRQRPNDMSLNEAARYRKPIIQESNHIHVVIYDDNIIGLYTHTDNNMKPPLYKDIQGPLELDSYLVYEEVLFRLGFKKLRSNIIKID